MTKYTDQGKNDTRSGYGDGMTELGRTNPNVVTLCADLVGSLKIQTFIDENPEFEILEGDSANFIVAVDGTRIFSKKHAQRWPVYREIPERVTEYLTQLRKSAK